MCCIVKLGHNRPLIGILCKGIIAKPCVMQQESINVLSKVGMLVTWHPVQICIYDDVGRIQMVDTSPSVLLVWGIIPVIEQLGKHRD